MLIFREENTVFIKDLDNPADCAGSKNKTG
jgi:hypothetical protein